MTQDLRDALRVLGDQVPPVGLPDDLWLRGRRARHRARVAKIGGALAAVVVALLATVLLLPLGLLPAVVTPAGDPGAVPHDVRLPWPWQATATTFPPGRASVMFSGEGAGLHGYDKFDGNGKAAVVGGDGAYRVLGYSTHDTTVGMDTRLSPDGRYVAHGGLAGTPARQLAITDLVTGSTRTYRVGDQYARPLAWRPDGKALLVAEYGAARNRDPLDERVQAGRLFLLDIASGEAKMLIKLNDDRDKRAFVPAAAFSPDGESILVQTYLGPERIDRHGAGRQMLRGGTLVWHVGGPGSVSPDGTLVAILGVRADAACGKDCDTVQLASRRWEVFIDRVPGATSDSAPKYAAVTGMAVQVLAWRSNGDLIVARYATAPGVRAMNTTMPIDDGTRNCDHALLLALHPDGKCTPLLDPPDQVLAVDVPQSLARDGKFGGPISSPWIVPPRSVILLPLLVIVIPLALLALAVRLLRRRVHHSRHRGRTGPVLEGEMVDGPRPHLD